MNTTVYLIRHGEILNPSNKVYGSLIDLPLSKEGIEQIKSLADAFKVESIVPDVIYSSFHIRGIKTAEILKEILAPNVKLKQANRLRDIDHPGLEKYSVPFIGKIDDLWNYNWPPEDRDIPIETRESMIKRSDEAIKDILKANKEETIFVIVHGHPSAFYIWSLLNPNEKSMPLPSDLIKEGIYLEKGKARKLIFQDLAFVKPESFPKIN